MQSFRIKSSAYAVPFLFMLLITISSCSSSTSSTPNNSSSNVTKPKVGSTFTDSTYTKDTLYHNVPSSGATLTYTLVDTMATKAGQANVYEFISSIDTVWQHYEANGDLSVYAPFAAAGYTVGSEWVTFPVSSQSSSNITTLKGFVLDSVTITGTMQGQGSGTQTVNGTALAVQKAQMNVSATSALAGTIPGTVTISFAPSIGLVTHQVITTTGTLFGTNINGGSEKTMIAYTLK